MIPLLFVGFQGKADESISISNIEPSKNLNPRYQGATPKYFNNSAFDNETIIQVSREVTVNSWSYITIIDTITISTNESSFNAFDYTMPLDLFENVEFFEAGFITDNNTNTAEMQMKTTSVSNIYTFIIDEIPSDGSEVTITITTGLSGLVKTMKDSLSEDPDIMPLRLSGINYFPWLSIPMTNFTFSIGIFSVDAGKELSNSTYLPKDDENPLDLTSSIVPDLESDTTLRVYTEITTLFEFNYSLIEDYPSKNNTEYIPAYGEFTEDVLTLASQLDYTTTYAPIEYEKIDVTIEFDEWGKVYHKEIISLRHMGIKGQTIGGTADGDSIPLFISSDEVSNIYVNDGFTNLSTTIPNTLLSKTKWGGGGGYPVNTTKLTITPRSPIEPGSLYTFELRYEVPVANRLNETSGFLSPAWDFKTPISSLFNWTVKNLELTIIFPDLASVTYPEEMWGVSVSSQNRTSVTGFMGFAKPALKLSFTNFSFYNNKFVVIQVGLPLIIGPFWDVFAYTLFFLVLSLIFVFVRTFSLSISSVATTKSKDQQIPYELIKDFVINYEEKTALRIRLTELAKRKKNLRKVEFVKLHQTLINKQNGNDRALVKVNSELVTKGSRYRDAIRSIELSEAEREQALESIKDLEVRKKQSRIRPEIYNKLKEEQNKKLRKSNSTIERVLVELRNLLTDSIN